MVSSEFMPPSVEDRNNPHHCQSMPSNLRGEGGDAHEYDETALRCPKQGVLQHYWNKSPKLSFTGRLFLWRLGG
jgi:hypothetical protein